MHIVRVAKIVEALVNIKILIFGVFIFFSFYKASNVSLCYDMVDDSKKTKSNRFFDTFFFF